MKFEYGIWYEIGTQGASWVMGQLHYEHPYSTNKDDWEILPPLHVANFETMKSVMAVDPNSDVSNRIEKTCETCLYRYSDAYIQPCSTCFDSKLINTKGQTMTKCENCGNCMFTGQSWQRKDRMRCVHPEGNMNVQRYFENKTIHPECPVLQGKDINIDFKITDNTFLDTEKTCLKFSIHPITLRKYYSEGKVRRIKKGKTSYYSIEDMENIFAEKERQKEINKQKAIKRAKIAQRKKQQEKQMIERKCSILEEQCRFFQEQLLAEKEEFMRQHIAKLQATERIFMEEMAKVEENPRMRIRTRKTLTLEI